MLLSHLPGDCCSLRMRANESSPFPRHPTPTAGKMPEESNLRVEQLTKTWLPRGFRDKPGRGEPRGGGAGERAPSVLTEAPSGMRAGRLATFGTGPTPRSAAAPASKRKATQRSLAKTSRNPEAPLWLCGLRPAREGQGAGSQSSLRRESLTHDLGIWSGFQTADA